MKFINFLISSLLLLTSHAYGDAVIFSGNDVKTLKPNIDLYGQGKILSGSTDPTSVATSAPVGSIYLNTSNGNLYRKVDAGSSTNWQKVGSAAVAGNLLPNPDWETGTTGWTASAGSYARTTTAADVGFGAGSGSFDASAASQTLTSTAVAIPTGLYASNGLASCYIKTAASDYIMQVYDGTNVISSATIAASTQYTRTNVNFIFPSSGNISLRISSQSNAAIMYMDDCYVGPATNISQVSQASFYGSTRISGMSANWSVSGTGVQDFPAIASATYTVAGNALSPTTNIPAIRFTNLPPGTYQIIARASMTQGASAGQCYYRLWDGSSYIGTDMLTAAANQDNPGPLTGSVTYSTTQSDITFRIRMRDQSLANNCLIRASAWNDLQVEFQVYRFPTSSELAVRPENGPLVFSGSHGADCSFAITNQSSYVDFPTDASCTFTSSTSVNSSVSSSSGSRPGIVFSPNTAGQYEVCASVALYTSSAATESYIRLQDVTNGTTLSTSNTTVQVAGTRTITPICGIYNATNTNSVDIRIQGQIGTNTLTVNGSTSAQTVAWSIKKITQSFPAPILVGSVTSNSAGAERVERVRVGGASDPSNCTSSPCTIYNQSGSWISSVTRSSAGQYTANIAAGIFSVAPTCNISAVNVGVTPLMAAVNTRSTTSFQFSTFNGSTTVAADSMYDIICMGPR